MVLALLWIPPDPSPPSSRIEPEVEKRIISISRRILGPFFPISSGDGPLDNFHSSRDEKTPVASMMSLQTTPLYGL